MKQIQLVALDVDGTLVDLDLKIPAEVRETVARAQSRGVQVILATGRMYASALPFAQELNIAGPLIAYNGALVMGTDGRVYDQEPVPKELVLQLVQLTEDQGLTLNVYVEDRLCVSQMNEDVAFYNSVAKVEPRIVGDLTGFVKGLSDEQGIHKVLIVVQPEEVQRLVPYLQQEYQGRLEVVMSRDRFIECTGAGVSKGAALKELCRTLGIEREQVLAVGDHFNDASMLEFAGVGVAMGTAPAEVKSIADAVVGSVKEGGLAEALERYVLAAAGS